MRGKIIHIVYGKAKLDKANGISSVVNQMATKQSSMGLEVSLWGICKKPNYTIEERNFETKLFPSTLLIPDIKEELRKEIKNSKKNNNLIFHVHGAFKPQLYPIIRQLIKLNLNYVITPHGAYNKTALLRKPFIKKTLIVFFEQKFVNNALTIHAVGESEIEGIKENFKPKNIVLIPNGINSLSVPKNCAKSDIMTLCYVGRIDIKGKGLDVLFKALQLYSQESTKWKLKIIGDGPKLKKLSKLSSKLGISNNVFFYGKLHGAKKFKEIQSSSFTCLFSKNEGLPMSILESLKLKVPVIISKQTNFNIYLEDFKFGFCSKNRSVLQIKNVISDAHQAFKNPSKYSLLRTNCSKITQSHFDWEKVIDQILLTYGF